MYCISSVSSLPTPQVCHSTRLLASLSEARFIKYITVYHNCVRPFSGMVLSAICLLFSVGYDKVEFYHLCCSVYIYIDDLIKELRSSGDGTHLSNLFIGSILYADDGGTENAGLENAGP